MAPRRVFQYIGPTTVLSSKDNVNVLWLTGKKLVFMVEEGDRRWFIDENKYEFRIDQFFVAKFMVEE